MGSFAKPFRRPW